MQLRFAMDTWIRCPDGDVSAFAIFKRHYSFYRYADNRRDNPQYRNRKQFVGPGQKLVLITPNCDALFVWRKFIDQSGQQGVNCAAFRNESPRLASDLILAAEEHARDKWPAERFYTYVNPKKVRGTNPGYCFKIAGWRRCGTTKGGLLIVEKVPDESNG